MIDPKNIVLSSLYESDKIVFTQKGSVAIASLPNAYSSFGFVIKRFPVPHGMPRPLFIEFRFSVDGGATWRTGSSGEVAIGYSTATDLVMLINLSSGTFLYEVFGSWIPDYDASSPPIAPVTTDSSTYFDSRLVYRKITKQNKINVSTGFVETPVPHERPQVPTYSAYFNSLPGQVWQEHAGGNKNKWAYDFNMVELFSRLDSTNIYFSASSAFDGPPTVNVWYRIFGDV